MKSLSLKDSIHIENREKRQTSRRRANDFVSRGLADWTDASLTRIRFRPEPDRWQMCRINDEARYWDVIARQRGGIEDVECLWAKTSEAPEISGGPAGYATMQARVIPRGVVS